MRDYLLDGLVSKNTQYKLFAQSLKELDSKEINQAFNGLKFKGQMNNSNLLPQETHVALGLIVILQMVSLMRSFLVLEMNASTEK